MPILYRLDQEGRYIILISFPDGTPQEVILETTRKVQDLISEWEKREQKYLVISLADGIEITLERIPDDSSSVRKQVDQAIVEPFNAGRT